MQNLTHSRPISTAPAVRAWLLACCLMVVLMVVVGGLTRLTESGLSMVRWEPVKGTLPPMTQSAWEEEFADYRTSPQYQQVFKGMSLEEFKGIFWLEYLHRLFGRLTGLVFLLPLIWFAATRKLSRPEVLKFTGIFFLGGLQGVMGWYMVKSGLVNDPQVSPYRLTAHLLLAFSIFALLWWEFLRRCSFFAPPLRGGGDCEAIPGGEYPSSVCPPRSLTLAAPPQGGGKRSATLILITLAATLLQIALGGFVAGNDAGLVFNTFPLMDGQLIPEGIAAPLGTNHAFVNFIHRWTAFILLGLVVWVFVASRKSDNVVLRHACELWLFGVGLQMVLGIATLLQVVPIALASLHQTLALVVWAIGLWVYFVSKGLHVQPR